MTRFLFGWVAAISFMVCVPSEAQWNSVGLSGDPYTDYDFITVYPGFIQVYVLVSSWSGLQAVEFTAPPPDCGGIVFLGQSAVFAATVGSAETGVSIAFGGCRSSRFPILILNYYTTAVDSCCPMDIVAHPNSLSGEVEGVDCQSNRVMIEGRMNTLKPPGITGCGHPTIPKNPMPPDGAVNLPLSVTLDWDSKPTAGTGLGVFFANVQFGSTPNPPITIWNDLPPQQVGPLTPNTTYYWRVTAIVTDYGSTTGPWWTFTTGAGVPVSASTWGAIKSMYTSSN